MRLVSDDISAAVSSIIERLMNGEITMDKAIERLIDTLGKDKAIQYAREILDALSGEDEGEDEN
jgi:hypothetical protein